jgi:hypothetical protein
MFKLTLPNSYCRCPLLLMQRILRFARGSHRGQSLLQLSMWLQFAPKTAFIHPVLRIKNATTAVADL